jgi:uncharacterized protein YndB with AHSA1/START domain
MTADKDFKRLVRGRMLKTGESYTAARSNLLKSNRNTSRPLDYAKLAGWSDKLIEAKTGCDWKRWVEALDYVQAHEWSHKEIARYINEKFKVPGWWTQTVTVGYERIKGLRAIGQRRDGGYEANKSRTYPVPLGRLYRGFSDKRNRAKWLPGVKLTVRTATRDKSMRITWPDGTSVVVGFLSKGGGKSSVQVQHGRLPDKAAADQVKAFWGERLGALAEVLV